MKHKCADCGFLATRNKETSNLDGMERNYRNTGKSPQKVGFAPAYDIYEPPICLMQVRDLWSEIGASKPENIRSVVQDDRDCDSFLAWKQGATPQEHRDMMDRAGCKRGKMRGMKQIENGENNKRLDIREKNGSGIFSWRLLLLSQLLWGIS